MSITKTAKIDAEIIKHKAKIFESQAKLKELEQKRKDIENSEIVEIVRGMSIPIDTLATMLQAVKSGNIPIIPTSGQNGQKSAASETEEDSE